MQKISISFLRHFSLTVKGCSCLLSTGASNSVSSLIGQHANDLFTFNQFRRLNFIATKNEHPE